MKTIFALTALAATLLVTPALANSRCLQQSQIYSWKALNEMLEESRSQLNDLDPTGLKISK